MAKIGGSGGISPEEKELLSKWTYDEQNNRMSTDASVRSGLNSFELAEMHTTHSGGENVFDQNNISKINWFPIWQGVRPLVSVGDHLGFNPTVRQYSDTFILEPNGSESTPNSVSYASAITLTDNESVIRLQVVSGENYTGRLRYSIKDTDANGIQKYQQFVDVDVVPDDIVTFDFTHPSESKSGDTIYVDIMKEDDTGFLVKSGTNTALPWLSLVLATYEDIEVVSATKLITESFTMRYAGDYEVDTTAGDIVITIPSNFKQAFNVSDANQSFNPTRSCTVSFGGTQGDAVLQTSKDAYKFYCDGSQWRFKDLNTKDGGVV